MDLSTEQLEHLQLAAGILGCSVDELIRLRQSRPATPTLQDSEYLGNDRPLATNESTD